MKLYLQSIVDDIAFDGLPLKWQDFDLNAFSHNKTLFDFQKQSLQNALKALHMYYKEKEGLKKPFYLHYQNNGLTENFDYDIKKKQDGKTVKYLLEYDKNYPAFGNKISFAYFINRMSFWMATGSGKTLIIIKLVDLLGRLINRGEIPKNDILFLAHREDLLEQFKNHVEEFNGFNFETKINLKSLKDYDSVKRDNSLPFSRNEITVFYYRSDLISDERKENLINFKNYDNDGKWYILLDEAHKGDREDSKRQIFYSILSRNGFLFNFSATFTDPRDFATCVFNFNLSKFIEEGYGKHIYVSGMEVAAFRDKDDFSEIEKQKIVLKTLILITYINKHFKIIKTIDKAFYHRPLLLTLVNSVNTEEADLKLFFLELEKIAKNDLKRDLIEKTKKELEKEFGENPKYEYEDISIDINRKLFNDIDYKDILREVFNADKPGNIEVLKIPGNKNEIIFKLQTSETPFALIKIGDISMWLKEKLSGYEIIESIENESIFKKINQDDSEINILMGSRAFYEGWDSNRPNIILFINIGIGSDAKKFVLQSVGRGVRIEPLKNKRKRTQNLYNAKEINDEIFNKIRKDVLPLESLFIFGTNAENLKEIINALKEEKQERDLGSEFAINKDAENRLLIIPVYKESDKIFAEDKDVKPYSISKQDFNLADSMFNYIGEKVALAKYECDIKILKKMKESFELKEKYFKFDEMRSIGEPELLIDRILGYFNVRNREFDNFKRLEDEIIHFKRIKFNDGEKFDQIINKIREVREAPEKRQKLKKAFDERQLSFDDMLKESQSLKDSQDFNYKNKRLEIKYIQNHYYIPVIISEEGKADYINHIIDVESEAEFINELEDYLQKDGNALNQFDWWMFSKIDETLDDVYIPYYNPKENNIAKFKPDFIFWMQKGNDYIILFVDPKGTEHADGYKKIDGYKKLFELKKFSFEGLNIKVQLLLKTSKGMANILELYKKYWFDNFNDFEKKLI